MKSSESMKANIIFVIMSSKLSAWPTKEYPTPSGIGISFSKSFRVSPRSRCPPPPPGAMIAITWITRAPVLSRIFAGPRDLARGNGG